MLKHNEPPWCLHVDGTSDQLFYLCYPDGSHYAGPYFRAQDAKGQLTRWKNEELKKHA